MVKRETLEEKLDLILKYLNQSKTNSKKLLSIKEAASLTGYTSGTIYQYVSKDASFPAYTPENGGKIFIPQDELESWCIKRKKFDLESAEIVLNKKNKR
ncbi:helix-turn-helix transcriptional regulator [Luteibaculum oceani]|nr:helix-turn-helix domain-containing protein [Luteibaculum oceani]